MIQLKSAISKTYLADSVYTTILENILSGTLPSGSEINEVGLAAQLQVSRTPVHEAISRLLKDGLVLQGPTRRLTVARFSSQEIREIYEMRIILEGAAVERSATRISKEELEDLRRRVMELKKQEGLQDWPDKALDFDLHFHNVLARSAGNERLRKEISRYRLLIRAFCQITGNEGSLEGAFQEHVRILEALESRDPAAACRAMKAHVEARLKTVIGKFYPEKP